MSQGQSLKYTRGIDLLWLKLILVYLNFYFIFQV